MGRIIIGPKTCRSKLTTSKKEGQPEAAKLYHPDTSMATEKEPEKYTTSRLAKQMVTQALMC